jgi:predicted DNA-binding transcriptional regulator AlpA
VVALRPLWSTVEVAECLALSPRTVRRWRSQGAGPGWFRVGREVRYDPAEVYRWLDEECEWSGPVEPPAPDVVAAWQAAARMVQRRRRSQAVGRGQLRLVASEGMEG